MLSCYLCLLLNLEQIEVFHFDIFSSFSFVDHYTENLINPSTLQSKVVEKLLYILDVQIISTVTELMPSQSLSSLPVFCLVRLCVSFWVLKDVDAGNSGVGLLSRLVLTAGMILQLKVLSMSLHEAAVFIRAAVKPTLRIVSQFWSSVILKHVDLTVFTWIACTVLLCITLMWHDIADVYLRISLSPTMKLHDMYGLDDTYNRCLKVQTGSCQPRGNTVLTLLVKETVEVLKWTNLSLAEWRQVVVSTMSTGIRARWLQINPYNRAG